jgi:type VI secretion system secreted protein VgrG
MKTRQPRIHGTQTAIVTGPSGSEIYTDKYGRIKVQFHWDRAGKKDEHSSCWIRVAQIWAGHVWGGWHLPRIGQEVVVAFLEGDPDRPLVVGSVYNAEQPVPFSLPANAAQSGLRTRSSLHGSAANFNELRFDDKKGSELVFLHAEKDTTTETEHDESHWVGHDETTTVDNDRTETVHANETITVDKDRTEIVHGNETITIDKDRTEVVDGYETITIDKDRSETVHQNHTLDVGKTISVTAGDQIVLKTGSATITMKKSGDITIDGKQITIKGSGDVIIKGQKILQN